MIQASNLARFRTGLTVKLCAMWILLAAVLLPLAIPSELGLFLAAFVPLSIDFAGRCLCITDTTSPGKIRLSIAAQLLGIVFLLIGFLAIPGGLIPGAILAAVLQAASAKLFVAHLLAIAQRLGRQDLIVKLEDLRKNLIRTTFAFYGVGVISFLVLAAAILVGIAAYVIGLALTLPMAFVVLLPLWTTCMVFYFLMLYSYQTTLTELRSTLSSYENVTEAQRS